MKRSLLAGLSILLLSATTTAAANATETRVEHQLLSLNQPTTQQLSSIPTPFELSFLTYQGVFKAQGIPSYGGLTAAVESGTVTAKDVVQAAIQTNRLPADTLMDQGYLNALMSDLIELESR